MKLEIQVVKNTCFNSIPLIHFLKPVTYDTVISALRGSYLHTPLFSSDFHVFTWPTLIATYHYISKFYIYLPSRRLE
jgi:hypothetical protein